MRRLVSLLAATGIAAATALVAVPAAGAATDPVPSPTTGRTTVKTLPGIAPAIVKAGVLPYAVSPGKLSGATLSPLLSLDHKSRPAAPSPATSPTRSSTRAASPS